MKSARLRNLQNPQNPIQALLHSGLGTERDSLRNRFSQVSRILQMGCTSNCPPGLHAATVPARLGTPTPMPQVCSSGAARCGSHPVQVVPGAQRESAARGGGAASHLGAFV